MLWQCRRARARETTTAERSRPFSLRPSQRRWLAPPCHTLIACGSVVRVRDTSFVCGAAAWVDQRIRRRTEKAAMPPAFAPACLTCASRVLRSPPTRGHLRRRSLFWVMSRGVLRRRAGVSGGEVPITWCASLRTCARLRRCGPEGVAAAAHLIAHRRIFAQAQLRQLCRQFFPQRRIGHAAALRGSLHLFPIASPRCTCLECISQRCASGPSCPRRPVLSGWHLSERHVEHQYLLDRHRGSTRLTAMERSTHDVRGAHPLRVWLGAAQPA